MRKVLISVFAVLICWAASAQDESIVTDRPTQSAGALVVPKGAFQIETGFVSEKVTPGFTNLTYNNTLIRWGALDGLELRLTQNIVGLKSGGTTVSGLSPLTLGTKVHLIEENGGLPQVSAIAQVTLKTGKETFQPAETIQELRFNFQNTVSDVFGLGYNLGLSWSDGSSVGFYTLTFGFAVADGWSVFAEPYGFFPEGKPDHRFNAGIIYLATDRLQFDVSGGVGISDISPDSFIGFGAAFLF